MLLWIAVAFAGGVLGGFLVAAMCSAAAMRDACMACSRINAAQRALHALEDANLSDLGEEHNVDVSPTPRS